MLKSAHVAMLLTAVSLGMMTGCFSGVSAQSVSDTWRKPPLGKACKVQIKRDLLGVHGSSAIGPTIERGDVLVDGTLVDVTSEWVIVSKGEAKEVWIPRDVVLLIDVTTGEKS
jgi:hypothetical protein